MHRFFVPIFFSALLGASAAIAHDIENQFSILIPGNFQDVDLDDFDFPPKGWLALIAKDGHWELTPTTVNIDNQVVTSKETKALALLHSRSLVAGKVETPNIKFLGERKRISIDSPSSFNISYSGTNYRVSIDKSGTVALQNSEVTTVLDSNREEASLVWAGDLDKDGKLDLILESGTDKNATYCLYLSGAVGPRALVKKIGCQFYSG